MEVATWVFILLGIVTVAVLVYTSLHGAIYDPSLPHDVLWRMLFGS